MNSQDRLIWGSFSKFTIFSLDIFVEIPDMFGLQAIITKQQQQNNDCRFRVTTVAMLKPTGTWARPLRIQFFTSGRD